MRPSDFGEWAFVLFFTILAFGVMGAGYLALSSPGNVNFCYIDRQNGYTEAAKPYVVFGSRDWQSDTQIGAFATPEEALEMITKSKCRLNSK